MNEKKSGYDYFKVTVNEDLLSQYMDGYENFGWKLDENVQMEKNIGNVTIHFKRERSILNKTELTRLQRHYEACMDEIRALEKSKQSVPTMVSLTCGLTGCAFMAGSVFAITATPPVIWLNIVLAVPGFILWGAAYFGYKGARRRQVKKVAPLIENKYEEAYQVCEQAEKLL